MGGGGAGEGVGFFMLGESTVGGGPGGGGIFSGAGMSKALASGWTPPARKILSIVVLLNSWYLQHWKFIFDTHLKTGKQRHDSNQETKKLSC